MFMWASSFPSGPVIKTLCHIALKYSVIFSYRHKTCFKVRQASLITMNNLDGILL
jgi:hypothetical protein